MLNRQASVPEVSFRTILSPTSSDTGLDVRAKVSVNEIDVLVSSHLCIRLEFCEMLLYWVRYRRVWCCEDLLHACPLAHLFDLFGTVNCSIIHDEDRFRLWPSVTVTK